MSKIFAIVAVVVAALAIVAVVVTAQAPPPPTRATPTIDYQYCTSRQCVPQSCQSQTFSAGECLRVENANHSVKFTCSAPPYMCGRTFVYDDAKCTNRISVLDAACNACNSHGPDGKGYTLSCGALFGAAFFVTNCSAGCGVCKTQTIVPFKKCKQVGDSGFYAMTWAPERCDVVSMSLYLNATDCSGPSAPGMYWQGHCNEGQILSCSGGNNGGSGSSGSGPGAIDVEGVVAQQQQQQRTIKLDMDRVKML